MCLLHISPEACSQAGFEFVVTYFYTCSEYSSCPRNQPWNQEDESTGPETLLPDGYILSYISINE